MKLKKYAILILAFLIFSLLSWKLFYYQNFESFPITDVNQQFLFAETLVKNRALKYTISLNADAKYPSIFGIRGLLIKNNESYPTSFLGIIFLWAFLIKLNRHLLAFVGPASAIIAGFFLSKIFGLFKVERNFRAIGLVLFFFLSPVLLYATIPYHNILSLSVFLASTYFLLKFYKHPRKKNLIIVAMLLGFQLWVRSVDLLSFLPLIFLVAISYKNRLKPLIRLSLFPALIFGGFLLPFLILNNYIYDNIFGPISLSGKTILNYFDLYNGDIANNLLLTEKLRNIFMNIYFKIILLNGPIIIFSILGIVHALKRKRVRKMSIAILSCIAFQLVFYGNKIWSGYDLRDSVGGSFDRYILISWAFFLLFSIIGLGAIKKSLNWEKISMILLFLAVILKNFNVFLFGANGYKTWLNVAKWTQKHDKPFLMDKGEKVIVFTSLYEKYFYPATTPAIYTTIPKEIRTEKTAEMAKQLIYEQFIVYFIHDTNPSFDFPLSQYSDAFKDQGLLLEKEREMYNYQPIYRVLLTYE